MSACEVFFLSLLPFVAVGALLLACSQGAVGADGQAEGPVNLLYNGSFEVVDPYLGSPDGWLHPLAFCKEVPEAPEGSRACLFEVEMQAPAVLLQEVAIDGSRAREVRLSGWCRLLDSRGGEFELRLRWHRYKRLGVGGRTQPAGGVRLSEADGRWHHLEGAFPVPEWADAVTVVVGFENGTGAAWVDDVRLEVPAAAVHSGATIPNRGNLWDDPRVPAEQLVHLSPDLPRPSLLFRKDDIPAIRERIERLPWAREIFEGYRERADEALALAVEIPDHASFDGDLDMNPEKQRLTRPHRTLLRSLYALALVYGVTGDERYARKGKEILLGYARKYPSYPMVGYDGDDGDDQSRLSRQVLTESVQFVDFAVEYDLLYSTLTADERQTCEDFLRHGAHLILANHRAEGNHGCWRSAGIGLVGLALRDDKLVNAELFGRWGFMRHMEWDVLDGFWYEGSMGYEVYALRAMTALTEAAYNCGVDVYRGNDVYKSLFDNLAANVGPDGVYPPFNDNNYAYLQTRFFEIAAARWGDESYRAVLASHREQRDLTALLLGGDGGAESATLPQGAVWPGAGQAVLRTGAGKDAAFLAVDFGPHTGFHSHWDSLTFYAYNRGLAMNVDPMAHSRMYLSPLFDGWARATFAHNTVSVDRANEKGGGGRCEFMEAGPYVKGVGLATEAAYEGLSQRRVLFLVDTDYLLCLDRLESASEHSYDWNYHGPGTVEMDLEMEEAKPESRPGYASLQSPHVGRPKAPWDARWRAGEQTIRVTADLQPGDEIRTGGAPKYLRSIDSSALTIRRRGTGAEFAVAVQAGGTSPEAGFGVSRQEVKGPGARGARVIVSEGEVEDTFLVRWGTEGLIEGSDDQLDGQYAWARREGGRLVRFVLAQGTSVRLGDIGLRTSEPGTCEMTRDEEGNWEVTWSGVGATEVEISGPEFQAGVSIEPGERIVLSQK